MKNPKQVIVMRKDLNMRKGKMIAQGAHASGKVFFDLMVASSRLHRTLDLPDESMADWLDGSFTKIAVGAISEAELDEVYQNAKNAGIPCAMIIDNGLTEFNGVKTKTCVAVGPFAAEEVDKITGHLPLL